MDSNFQVKKGRKFLPITSIVVGLLLAGSLLPKDNAAEKTTFAQIAVTLIIAIAFFGLGILSLNKRGAENTPESRTAKGFKYIVWIFFAVLLVAMVPLMLLVVANLFS